MCAHLLDSTGYILLQGQFQLQQEQHDMVLWHWTPNVDATENGTAGQQLILYAFVGESTRESSSNGQQVDSDCTSSWVYSIMVVDTWHSNYCLKSRTIRTLQRLIVRKTAFYQ